MRDLITFEGASVTELEESLKLSVETYLEHCRETGCEPDKLYSGNISLRTTPDLHRCFISA